MRLAGETTRRADYESARAEAALTLLDRAGGTRRRAALRRIVGGPVLTALAEAQEVVIDGEKVHLTDAGAAALFRHEGSAVHREAA